MRVVIPTYNGAGYINRCLDSLLRQEYRDWIAVIGDDGSSDSTLSMVRSYRDQRLKVVDPSARLGALHNTNRLLKTGYGDLTAVLHQDDWWEPGFLAALVNLLDKYPSAILATCGVNVHGFEGVATAGFHTAWKSQGLCPSDRALRIMAGPNPMYIAGVVVRSDMYRELGGFEARLPLTYDWWAWISAARLGDFAVTSRILANYGEHGASISQRALRDGAWAHDFVRLDGLLRAGGEASTALSPDIRESVRRTVWALVLGQALRQARTGDSRAASETLRLADSVATGLGPSVLTRSLRLLVLLLGRRLTAVLARRLESTARRAVASRWGARL